MCMKLNNPFVLAGYKGPAYFCDRVKETKRLCDAIKNESNVTLLSPRRYGKTGLIRNAFYKLERSGEYETIYVDAFGAQNLADFTKLLADAVIGRLDTPLEKMGATAKRLIAGIRPTLSYDETNGRPSLSFDISKVQAERTLADIFDYLKDRERRVVIAIDEFQQIGNFPEKGVEATLRSHVQFSPARFIFAGSKQHLLRDMFTSPKRPFYQSSLMMPIDVIPKDSYYDFAERFFTEAGRHLDRDVFEELYRRFDGITWYVQALLWDFYAQGGNINNVSQLDDAVRLRVESSEYDQQRLLELIPDGARRLMKAIAIERAVKSPQSGDFITKYGLRAASSVKTSLTMLLDKELVYRGSEGYVIYDRFFAEYLRSLVR